jgi:hypothetical protein
MLLPSVSCWGDNVIRRSTVSGRALTFVMNILVHCRTSFSVWLFAPEINIGTNRSMQERLRRSEIVAQRCFGVIWPTLHQPPQSMELRKEEKDERSAQSLYLLVFFCNLIKIDFAAKLQGAFLQQHSQLKGTR